MTASVGRRRWYGPGMSSCATPRISPGLRSCARTRSPATHWRASSHCESAKPSDRTTVATLEKTMAVTPALASQDILALKESGRVRLDGRPCCPTWVSLGLADQRQDAYNVPIDPQLTLI